MEKVLTFAGILPDGVAFTVSTGWIVTNAEVGPWGPEIARDHARVVDLQGCGEHIYKIGP